MRSMLRRVMLPQYYSIARLVTMFDFLMVIWLLIAAQPTELWCVAPLASTCESA